MKFSLPDLKREIERALRSSIRRRQPQSLTQPAHYLVAGGGKRLRSVLLLLSSMAVGGSYRKAIPAAVAIELLHNFSLVHDDIMDNDDIRRGRDTVHKKWDANVAILAGDFLSALSILEISRLPTDKLPRVLQIFAAGYVALCEGQALDKEFESRDDVTRQAYLRMIGGKTAALFATATQMGAVLGGGKPAMVETMRQFGLAFGMAFQIQDDLLDIMADESVLGKEVGSDLVENKKTYIVLAARDHEEGLRLLKRFHPSNTDASHQDALTQFRAFLDRSGIRQSTESAVARYLRHARRHLEYLPSNPARDALTRILDDTARRQH